MGRLVFRVHFGQPMKHCDHNVANICFSESSIGSDFALIEDNLVAAMPRQEDPPAAKEQPGWGSQASMQAGLGGAEGESATSPGKENEDVAVAAAKKQHNMLLMLQLPQRRMRHNIWPQRRSGRRSRRQSGNVSRRRQKHKRCEMKPGQQWTTR